MSDINLIHGDCLIEIQHIPDKSVDMVVDGKLAMNFEHLEAKNSLMRSTI